MHFVIRAGIVVISDGCHQGTREDRSGPLIAEFLEKGQIEVAGRVTVPDDVREIRKALLEMTDHHAFDLVITTGGTGIGPRDVTPEAMSEVFEKEVPGIALALLAKGISSTPYAMISRGRAGIRKKSLIINLPGSPRAVLEGMETIVPIIDHALLMMSGGGHSS
jgi:molybdopterin adenylyltransferase